MDPKEKIMAAASDLAQKIRDVKVLQNIDTAPSKILDLSRALLTLAQARQAVNS